MACDVYDSKTLFSVEQLAKPVITFSFIRVAAQVYTQYSICLCVTVMMDANYRLGFQPDNGATAGLQVEQSERWSGSRCFSVFCIMSVLVTSPSLQIRNDMCELLFQGTFN